MKAVIGMLTINVHLAVLEVTNLNGTVDCQGQQLQIKDTLQDPKGAIKACVNKLAATTKHFLSLK